MAGPRGEEDDSGSGCSVDSAVHGREDAVCTGCSRVRSQRPTIGPIAPWTSPVTSIGPLRVDLIRRLHRMERPLCAPVVTVARYQENES